LDEPVNVGEAALRLPVEQRWNDEQVKEAVFVKKMLSLEIQC
jgi:hypothetical protein